ncbi:hypothetical protein ACFL13_01920 [Patescibacteria group bacterium]
MEYERPPLPEMEDPRRKLSEEAPFLEDLTVDNEKALEMFTPEELEYLKNGKVELGRPRASVRDNFYPQRSQFDTMHMESLVPIATALKAAGPDVRESPIIATYERPKPTSTSELILWKDEKIFEAVKRELVTALYEEGIKAFVPDGNGNPIGRWNTEKGPVDVLFEPDTKFDIKLRIKEDVGDLEYKGMESSAYKTWRGTIEVE